jgi:hypothetical protein
MELGGGLGNIPPPDGVQAKEGSSMASAVESSDVVGIIANEIALGVDRAVEFWMSQIDHALNDPHLTSLGRLSAVKEIVQNYRIVTGKDFVERWITGNADQC